jgi:hypothetical protein
MEQVNGTDLYVSGKPTAFTSNRTRSHGLLDRRSTISWGGGGVSYERTQILCPYTFCLFYQTKVSLLLKMKG